MARRLRAAGRLAPPASQFGLPNQATAAIPNVMVAYARYRHRGGTTATGTVVVRAAAAMDGGLNAWTNWAAGLNRSAGFLASVRDSAPATSGGTVGRRFVTGAASVMRCWRVIASAVGPVNGGCPPSIS